MISINYTTPVSLPGTSKNTCKITFEELIQLWQLQLQNAEAMENDLPVRQETCIRICEESLLHLRQWVTAHSFPDKGCEIYFFKQVKPAIMARCIYYQKIYRLHTGYFNGSGLLEKERPYNGIACQ